MKFQPTVHCAPPFLCSSVPPFLRSSVPPFLRSSVPPFLLLRNCCTILDLCLKSEIMDVFWSSRCLNDHIDLPDKIGSFSSGATTSMVVKNGTKKTFEGFSKCLKCFTFLNMSHGNGSSAFVSQVTGFFLPVTGSADPWLRLS